MTNEICQIIAKALNSNLKNNQEEINKIEFGSVTFAFTIHNGEPSDFIFTIAEKKRLT